MALVIKDRVQETTTTVGTIPVVLGGAVTNFVAFSSVLANGDTTYYAIISPTEWEVGLGTYDSGTNSLARTTVYASSNGGSLVNFAAGTKYVYIDALADRLLMKDANNTIASPAFSGTISGTPGVNSGSSLANQVVTVTMGSFQYGTTIPTLTTTGTGTTATLTWSTTLTVLPPIGSSIIVTGVVPTAYNGTYTVTAVTATSVSYASTATGAMSTAGSIQFSEYIGAVSQSFSVPISTALWNAASTVTGSAVGASQPVVPSGNAGAAINALGDELEMDNLVVAASLGTSPNINVYVSTVGGGPVVGPRQIALKLF